MFQRAGSWQAFAIEGGRARLRTVRIGRSNGTESEILDGLREGESIVVYPGDKVSDGARITPLSIGGR